MLDARDAGSPIREAGRLTALAISVDVGTGADCVVRRAGLLVTTRFEAAIVVGAGSVLELTRARPVVRVVVGAGAGASTGADCVWVRGIVSRVSSIRLVGSTRVFERQVDSHYCLVALRKRNQESRKRLARREIKNNSVSEPMYDG